ncbi:MAG: hypothetical protein H0U23_03985 [Blastocatellia bacterium]|nr:hypothetical protein [Blastocatellia bacterium]
MTPKQEPGLSEHQNRRVYSRFILFFKITLSLLIPLSFVGCSNRRGADLTILACLDSQSILPIILNDLTSLSDRYGYVVKDDGISVKADIKEITADESIIPSGIPVNMYINDDGDTVLMAVNFGSPEDALRLSFFFKDDDSKNLDFNKDVVSSLMRTNGVSLHFQHVGQKPPIVKC